MLETNNKALQRDMSLKHYVIVLLFLVPHFSSFSQRYTAKHIFPDSIQLMKGIYFSKEEFLTNDPGVTYRFEVINKNPDYIVHPEERNRYYITYYDQVGKRKVFSLKDIWGFYDGYGVHISIKGRPYELLHLGAISVLRYEQYFKKHVASQTFSLLAIGATATHKHKVDDVYFDFNGSIWYPVSPRAFKKIISKDADFLAEYKKDKKTSRRIKTMIYLEKFNKKYPVQVTQKGIRFTE